MPRRSPPALFASLAFALLLASVPGLVTAQVVQVASSSSTNTISNSNGWGKGGNPKPTPTPSPVPTPPPVAGDPDWTGATSTTWSTTTNWSPAATPGPADVAKFTGTFTSGRQPNLTANASAGGLWMTGTLGQNVTISRSGAAVLTLNGTTINSISGLGILVDNTDARTLTISAPVTLGGAQTWRNNSSNLFTVSGAVDTNANALTIDGSGDTTLSGVISDSGAITLAGSGVVTFSNTGDTYSGKLTVQSGTLSIDNANNNSSNGELGNNALSVTLGGSGTTGTLEFTAGNDATTKKFTMAAGGTGVFQVDTAATTLTLSGVIDGSGALTKTGPGILDLNATNTYTGLTTVSEGTLEMGSATALNSANVVSVAAGATFDINGNDETIAGLNGGTGTVTNNGGAHTLTLAGTGTYTFGGVLTAHDGNHNDLKLVKSGSGTQTLTGASLYNGGTTINAGTLLANNTTGSATGPGDVTVNSGGTLGGTGTVAPSSGNKVTVNGGGILEGGAGSTGQTLTVAGALTLANNSIIELALGPGGTHSTLARSGTGTWTFDSNQAFTFINLGATPGFYNNIITGLASDPGTESGWTITNPGFIATFVYDGMGDIDLNVTAIPEPSTYFAGALALVGLAYFQRKRLAAALARA